jgi:hypothetical protein
MSRGLFFIFCFEVFVFLLTLTKERNMITIEVRNSVYRLYIAEGFCLLQYRVQNGNLKQKQVAPKVFFKVLAHLGL